MTADDLWGHTADAARRILAAFDEAEGRLSKRGRTPEQAHAIVDVYGPQAAARPCATCDGGDPRCKDCFGMGTEVMRCEQCDDPIDDAPVFDEWGWGPPFCSDECLDAYAERKASR